MGWCFRRCPPSFSTASHADTGTSWQIASIHHYHCNKELQGHVDVPSPASPTPAAFKCEDYSEGRLTKQQRLLQRNSHVFAKQHSFFGFFGVLEELKQLMSGKKWLCQKLRGPISPISPSSTLHCKDYNSTGNEENSAEGKSEIWSFWSFCSM